MLVTFKSRASADVIMFGDPARRLLEILGKGGDTKGIVTVEQLPGAIAALRAAIDEDKAQQQAARDAEAQAESDECDPEQRGMAAPVGLAQRAWPLLDMLETAQREEVPVVWGV